MTCFLTWKLALDEILNKMKYNVSLIYMVVGYLENSLHFESLQKYLVFNMESAVRLCLTWKAHGNCSVGTRGRPPFSAGVSLQDLPRHFEKAQSDKQAFNLQEYSAAQSKLL